MDCVLNILGIIFLFVCAYVLSYHKQAISWKLIGRCLLLQFVWALFLVKVPIGSLAVSKLGDFITTIVGYSRSGLEFVFGSLVNPTGASGFIFVVQVLGTIIFVGSLVEVLNYLGVLGWIIAKLGHLVGKISGCSQLEGFICTANIFLSDTEAPFMMSRYLKFMTKSEIMAMLVSGMSSMSVSIFGGYIAMGIPANYLIIASALVPFSSIIINAMLLPEEEKPQIVEKIDLSGESKASNIIEAIANGSMKGIEMVIAIAASIVAIISMVSLVNGGLAFINLKLEQIFAWLFSPFAYFMGLGNDLTLWAGELLGSKMILTEFIPFAALGKVIDTLNTRTAMMLSVAISGFANVSSMAICVSGIAALCPEMRGTLSKLVFKGMLGGFAASVLNALILGIILWF